MRKKARYMSDYRYRALAAFYFFLNKGTKIQAITITAAAISAGIIHAGKPVSPVAGER